MFLLYVNILYVNILWYRNDKLKKRVYFLIYLIKTSFFALSCTRFSAVFHFLADKT